MINEYRDRYEALMEGLGLDPSPDLLDEYTPARLKTEAYGTRMSEERLIEDRDGMLAALVEVAGILRQRNQYGWESRLLGIVDTAITKAKAEAQP